MSQMNVMLVSLSLKRRLTPYDMRHYSVNGDFFKTTPKHL